MAKSGSFYLDASSQETTYWTYMQGWVGWTESNVSAENNTSKVTVELQCHKSAGSKTTGTWAYSIYINGSCVVSSSWYGSIATDWVTIATASATVPHNADGSKTVSIYAKISGPGSTTMSGKSSSATGYAALTTIPRASTIGATDANIGSTSVIAVTKMTSGYTHTIAYAFGTQTGYLDADGAMVAAAVKMTTTSLSMAVPEAWYAEIPAAKSGVCTLTCITYSGDTQIGDAKTATFTVTASEALCAPSVSGTIEDINAVTAALTGDSAKLIRYASTAKLTITAAGKNSAAIEEKTIAGQTVTDGTRTVTEVETNRFTFAATDSRGYIAQAVVTAEMVEYVRLTNNVTIKRTDATSGKAALSLKGTYFSGSFGAAENALTVKYRIKTKGGTFGEYAALSPTISGNGYSFTGEIAGLEYTSEWVVEITVSDCLMSKTVEAAVGKGIPIANWGEDFWQFNVEMRMATADGEAHALTPALVQKLAGLTQNDFSITKLWENASPTSDFAAQTIELDLSGYDFVDIAYYGRTGPNNAIATNGYYVARLLPGKYGALTVSSLIGASTDYVEIESRTVYVTETGIRFDTGKSIYMNADSHKKYNDESETCIPYRIYGIKGVK